MSRLLPGLTASLLAGVALPALAVPQASGDLLQNSGFQTGTLAGWTTTGSVDVQPDGSGAWYAILSGGDGVSIGQMLSGAYTLYDLDFWAAGTPFDVIWDGNQIAAGGADPGLAWQETRISIPAAPGAHQLAFRGLTVPSVVRYVGGASAFNLRNISLRGSNPVILQESAPVPEPSSIALLGIGLFGTGAALYRKKSRGAGLVPTGPIEPDAVQNRLLRIQPALRRAGVTQLGLAGSVARNQATAISDVDLVASFATPIHLGALRDLVRLTVLERYLSGVLQRSVDMLPDTALSAEMRQTTGRDLRPVF